MNVRNNGAFYLSYNKMFGIQNPASAVKNYTFFFSVSVFKHAKLGKEQYQCNR
jgi:hypothetical protein